VRLSITERATLFFSPACRNCTAKLYLLPKNVTGQQLVENLSYQVDTPLCTARIAKDSYGNLFLLLHCYNTFESEVTINFVVRRFCSLPPAPTNVSKKENLEYYTGNPAFAQPHYMLSLSASSSNLLEAMIQYLTYISQRFVYVPSNSLQNPLQTLYSLQGNCADLAWLLAAIFRNLGIPAKVAEGLLLNASSGKLHAWVEAWIENSWYPIDLLTKQYGCVDPRHIYFAELPRPLPVAQVNGSKLAGFGLQVKYSWLGSPPQEPEKLHVKLSVQPNITIINIKLYIINQLVLPVDCTVRLFLGKQELLEKQIFVPAARSVQLFFPLDRRYIKPGNYTLVAKAVFEPLNIWEEAVAALIIASQPNISVQEGSYSVRGSILHLWLTVENAGKGAAKNLTVQLLLPRASGFACVHCTEKIKYLAPGKKAVLHFVLRSYLPLLPSKMFWKIRVAYYSVDGTPYSQQYNLLVLYAASPGQKLLFIIIGIIIIVVIVWAITRFRSVV